MSYEGYRQFICPRGHTFSRDVYDADADSPTCDECGRKPIWRNSVDETNGDAFGYVELTSEFVAKQLKAYHEGKLRPELPKCEQP